MVMVNFRALRRSWLEEEVSRRSAINMCQGQGKIRTSKRRLRHMLFLVSYNNALDAQDAHSLYTNLCNSLGIQENLSLRLGRNISPGFLSNI
jgi:hypothetical protein